MAWVPQRLGQQVIASVLEGRGLSIHRTLAFEKGRQEFTVFRWSTMNRRWAAFSASCWMLPVILCTGYSEARAREIGIQDYLTKPVTSRILLARIAELLEV